jgi:PAS domain S-box-containing protein
MPEGPDERERYGLLGWFARDVAVGPRAACYRCVTTDEFRHACVVRSADGEFDVIATTGDGQTLEGVRPTVETAIRERTVQLVREDGRTTAAVPLTHTADALALVLGTEWDGCGDDGDRSFLEELGAAASAAVGRDGREGAHDPGDGGGRSAANQGALGVIDDAAGRRKLQALQVTAENLVRARSATEISRVAVETARDVLDFPITGVWLYDAEAELLKPAAVTDEGRELLGEPVSFGPGESLAWEAFETGEIGRYDDVRTVEGAYNPGTPIRSELDIPIGRHGVLTTATTRRAEFSRVDMDLLRILVSNTEAVLDRTEQERDIERYRKMVEAANDPIWAIDTDGRLTHANEQFVDLSALSREALLGSSLSDVFPGDLVERTWETIGDLRDGDDHTTTYQETVPNSNGRAGTYQISLSLLWDDEGAFEGAVFVAHDVTELRLNEQLLSVFNRVLRHNLRNRMNLVLTNVDALAEFDDERVSERARTAAIAARELLDLGEKTRRFQDVIVPNEPAVESVNIAEAVANALAGVRGEFPDVTLRGSVPDDVWVQAPGTLPFAIEELVENAIRHCDVSPEVAVSASTDEAGDTVELRVADNGPGIPEVERQGLSRDLEQPLEHTSGLGLWMVRWSANTAGGSLEIRDNEPRGAVVAVRLPRADATGGG